MGAAHVKRGAGARTAAPQGAPRVAVPKKLAAQAAGRAGRGQSPRDLGVRAVRRWRSPSSRWSRSTCRPSSALAAGEAVGDAGFRVAQRRRHRARSGWTRKPVYRIALDQQTTALPLVDVAAIRERLLDYGWVKDARVSRRYPDTLVIDIVERTPAALWQDGNRLSLIDAEGVVLDQVAVTRMPDLPLLVGAGANGQARALDALLGKAPTIKAQLVSASWVGQRRWDLAFQTGETIALPEGEAAAATALAKFAENGQVGGPARARHQAVRPAQARAR